MNLPNDVSRCVGRNALTADGPVCERREQCARYVALLNHPKGESVMVPVAMHLCGDGDDGFIPADDEPIPYTITAKGRAILEGK